MQDRQFEGEYRHDAQVGLHGWHADICANWKVEDTPEFIYYWLVLLVMVRKKPGEHLVWHIVPLRT